MVEADRPAPASGDDRRGGDAVREGGNCPSRCANVQASAVGLSLDDTQRNYSDEPLSRRTAERLRHAVARLYPRAMEQANPGEVPKRQRLPGGMVAGLARATASELADLGTAISLQRRDKMNAQAENAERDVAKLRALVKRPVLNGIESEMALTDGSLIVRLRAGGGLEMCWHLFTWGDQLNVLAPRKLAVLLNDRLRRVAVANAALSLAKR